MEIFFNGIFCIDFCLDNKQNYKFTDISVELTLKLLITSKDMVLEIYALQLSPPCQAVLLTAKLLGIPYEFKNIDPSKNDQFNPQFLKVIQFNKLKFTQTCIIPRSILLIWSRLLLMTGSFCGRAERLWDTCATNTNRTALSIPEISRRGQ